MIPYEYLPLFILLFIIRFNDTAWGYVLKIFNTLMELIESGGLE